jgi:hypothetical protein
MLIVLKILGIILLCIVALIIALLCAVLFIPIHYRAEADYHDRFSLDAEAHCLYGALRFIFSKPQESALLIFGKALGSSKNNGQSAEHPEKEDKEEEYVGKKQKVSDDDDKDKPSLSQRIEYFNSIDKTGVLRESLRCLARLIKALLPRHLNGRLDLAFADPGLTGMAYGLCCAAIYPLGLQNNLIVTSNFERDKIAATLSAGGSINIWSIVWPLAALALSKPVRPITIGFIFKKGATNER